MKVTYGKVAIQSQNPAGWEARRLLSQEIKAGSQKSKVTLVTEQAQGQPEL